MKTPRTIAKMLYQGLKKSEKAGNFEPEAKVEANGRIYWAIFQKSAQDTPIFISQEIDGVINHSANETIEEIETELTAMFNTL